mgnify:FL=1
MAVEKKNAYEAVLVFSMNLGEDGISEIKDKFKALIEQNAENLEVDEWGKRRLAYPINFQNEGYYVLYEFVCAPDFPAELDRVCNITEGVLRSLIVRIDD